jgi:ubiquinone/menaquinone biosynthesis C-methylase UbiE
LNRDSEEIKATYNRIARAYSAKRKNPNESPWNNYLEIPAMRRLLEPLVSAAEALDLGCGTGLLTQELQSLGVRSVVGIDQSEEMIRIAKKDNPDLTFSVGPSDRLPFKDQSFDLVASSLMLHYLKDFGPTLGEIARVLRPQGSFVFSMHHPVQECLQNENALSESRLSSTEIGPYFHNESYKWKMCGAEILSFHHTFEDIVNGLSDAGFSTQRMIETRPAPENSYPGVEHNRSYPTFLVVWAQLTQN